MLENHGVDIRTNPLSTRRQRLETVISNLLTKNVVTLSPVIQFETWESLATLCLTAWKINSEGIMLKKMDSVFHSGRKRGDWWKWKINPYTIDTVMIYAQKGSGRRANFYTDYTFAVRDGKKLITIAKAYSGLIDKEIKEVNVFVVKKILFRITLCKKQSAIKK